MTLLKMKMSDVFLLGCLVVSQLLCFVNVGWALSCNGVGGNWSSPSSWALCSDGVPGGGDTAKFIVGAVNLNTDVTVDQIRIEGGTLNAGTHTITLSNTTPFAPVAGGGTFNADTGTVKLTKADHTIINDFTYNNDSPVIGAGTYAKNATCAISCT